METSSFKCKVNLISAMLEAITLVHLVTISIASLISIIIGVELVGIIVHACVVSIVVGIHAVTAIIVGGSAHLYSPILRLMFGKSCFNDLVSRQIQGSSSCINRRIGICLTAKRSSVLPSLFTSLVGYCRDHRPKAHLFYWVRF